MTIDSTIYKHLKCTIPKVEQIAFKEKLAMTHRILTFLEGYIQFPQMNIPTDLNKNEDIEELATEEEDNTIYRGYYMDKNILTLDEDVKE